MSRTERRNSHRYSPARGSVCLGWWEGREFRTVLAQLRNLSTSGGMVFVEQGCPAAKRVWICLAGQAPALWVPAEVREVEAEQPGAGCIRLSFFETFPYEPFKAAVWGDQGGDRGSPHARPDSSPPTHSSPESDAAGITTPALTEDQRIRFFLGIAIGPEEDRADCHGDPSRTTHSPHPPTLVQAHHAQLVFQDRIASFPWLTVSAVSLFVVLMLALVVAARLEDVRWLTIIPGLTR
jgi:hypothetical protein